MYFSRLYEFNSAVKYFWSSASVALYIVHCDGRYRPLVSKRTSNIFELLNRYRRNE
ncbi:unnamed protein product, partial [Allacma fusca]